ncbi:MAG: mechanosensitive ion channel family protein [Bacteroidetes bacterium]|nr:MAG: mechanosensitive ion channel family protein [Bacteroidota bacterium]REK00378.1 MAG: mechanosensitive ion channel family protein [Bacteroidota bacterium]REK35497.1 MAG: mechanosensitive ion channel family protein [Bacteroidota bacterium]REK50168.1 MAG: mechanosensitive ion channel family protein [Bacteroidota bacterium]
MKEYLHKTFLGNTLEDYLWFAGILIFGLILKKFLAKILSRILYRLFRNYGKTIGVEKFIELLHKPFGFLILVVLIYLAFDRLTFPAGWELDPGNVFGVRYILHQIFQGAIIVAFTWLILRVVDFIGLVLSARAALTESKLDDQLVPFAKEAVKILIAGFGFMIMLATVFDLNVVSLVTGLGIGGLAFALAAKETLENLLGSFTIFLDKPFVVGDMVKVGNIEGRVESIGFRSTRIRSLDRMLVTVPNKKMVDFELNNDTERTVRRARFNVGLIYSTTEKQIRDIVSEISALLDTHPLLEPKRVVRFNQFGQSSLDILIIYLARTPELEDFLRVQEEINFKIMEIVRKNGSDFAYPTSTVFLRKEDS